MFVLVACSPEFCKRFCDDIRAYLECALPKTPRRDLVFLVFPVAGLGSVAFEGRLLETLRVCRALYWLMAVVKLRDAELVID